MNVMTSEKVFSSAPFTSPWVCILSWTKTFSLTQEEYLRAYYAAILESQQKASQAAAATAALSEPNIALQNPIVETVAEGSAMTVKKEDGEDDDDDVEWEDAPAAGMYTDMPSAPFWKIRYSWIFHLTRSKYLQALSEDWCCQCVIRSEAFRSF